MLASEIIKMLQDGVEKDGDHEVVVRLAIRAGDALTHSDVGLFRPNSLDLKHSWYASRDEPGNGAPGKTYFDFLIHEVVEWPKYIRKSDASV